MSTMYIFMYMYLPFHSLIHCLTFSFPLFLVPLPPLPHSVFLTLAHTHFVSPCLPPSLIGQERLGEVEVFQREAQEELDHVTRQAQVLQTAPTSHLSRLLTRGESLGIEVPELDQLRVVSQTAQHTHLCFCSQYIVGVWQGSL